MNKKRKLKSLEWFVYTLLEKETLGTDKTLTQREIYDACKAVGFPVSWNENQNQHNDHCRWLATVCDKLNKSLEVDKIVHHHAYRYYICTKEQAEVLLQMLDNKIRLASIRKRQIRAKMKRNGQGKLLSNKGNLIDEKSKALRFYETYNQTKLGGTQNATNN